MSAHSVLDQNDELGGKYYMSLYKRRFEQYGPHPNCKDCLKVELCMVPNMPGYQFECHERVDSADAMMGVVPACSRTPKKGEF